MVLIDKPGMTVGLLCLLVGVLFGRAPDSANAHNGWSEFANAAAIHGLAIVAVSVGCVGGNDQVNAN